MRMTRRRRRHPVQHLAHRLADRMQGAATTRAGRHLEVEVHVLALQMLGQARPIRSVLDRGLCWRSAATGSSSSARAMSAPRSSRPSSSWSPSSRSARRPNCRRCSFCTINRRRSISACASDSALRSPARSAASSPDQPMQGINIIRQGSKIDVHDPDGYACSRPVASRFAHCRVNRPQGVAASSHSRPPPPLR